MFSTNQSKRLILGGFLLLAIATCSSRTRSAKEIVYLIPENFEGAVVIIYGQKGGSTPEMEGDGLVFKVPSDGILRVNSSEKEASGMPKFFYVQNGGLRSEIELLVSSDPTGKYRNSRQVSEEERESKVFAISYERGEFVTSSGGVRYRNFRIGKDKDGNLNYTRMQEKIFDVQKSFPTQ